MLGIFWSSVYVGLALSRRKNLVKRMSKVANNFNFKQVSYSNWGEKCPICKMMRHLATQCHKFRGMNPAERMKIAKKVQLCTKCLRHSNNQKCSSEYLCSLCNKSRHTMLHINIQKREKVNTCVTATQACCSKPEFG